MESVLPMAHLGHHSGLSQPAAAMFVTWLRATRI